MKNKNRCSPSEGEEEGMKIAEEIVQKTKKKIKENEGRTKKKERVNEMVFGDG
jgi:hypothetical protein